MTAMKAVNSFRKCTALFAFTLLHCLPFSLGNYVYQEHMPVDQMYEADVDEDFATMDRENMDLDEDIPRVCMRLRSLDIKLDKMNRDPPEKGGLEMLRLLRAYNQACHDFLFVCSIDKLKVLEIDQEIMEQGTLKFFRVPIDEKLLEGRFHWFGPEMDHLRSEIEKTRTIWDEMWYIYNNYSFKVYS